jgi:hypothetical protein
MQDLQNNLFDKNLQTLGDTDTASPQRCFLNAICSLKISQNLEKVASVQKARNNVQGNARKRKEMTGKCKQMTGKCKERQ